MCIIFSVYATSKTVHVCTYFAQNELLNQNVCHFNVYSGYYANGRFLLQAFKQLLDKIMYYELEMPYLSFSYMSSCRVMTLQQIYDNLVKSMDLVFRELIGDKLLQKERRNAIYQKGKDLFINTEGLPDGSAIYGILLNSYSVAVNGFGDAENIGMNQGESVLIEDVEIHDLALKVDEVPAIYFDECMKMKYGLNTGININKGPFGDIIDLRKMIPEDQRQLIENLDVDESLDLSELEYAGNPLSDAQIALFMYGDYILNEVGKGINYAYGSYISPYLLKWALNDYGEDNTFPTCVKFVCNGDLMFHTNKG